MLRVILIVSFLKIFKVGLGNAELNKQFSLQQVFLSFIQCSYCESLRGECNMKYFMNSFDLDNLHVFFPEHFLIYHKNRCSNEHAKKSFRQIGFLKIFFLSFNSMAILAFRYGWVRLVAPFHLCSAFLHGTNVTVPEKGETSIPFSNY